MADFGFKGSLDNVDVLTAPDSSLAFTSKYSFLKVLAKGSIAITSPTTININHNLGYAPTFLVTFFGGGFISSDARMIANYQDQGGRAVRVQADSNQLTITTSMSWSGNIYYYIFVDPGT